MWTEVSSPIGAIRLTASGNALTGVFMLKHKYGPEGFPAQERGESPILREAGTQLGAYFAGTLRDFDLPLETGGSDFQRQVWDELRRIPFGETTSYLAHRQADRRRAPCPGRGHGQRPQPDLHHHSLPPRGRERRVTRGIRRRSGTKALAAGPRDAGCRPRGDVRLECLEVLERLPAGMTDVQ